MAQEQTDDERGPEGSDQERVDDQDVDASRTADNPDPDEGTGEGERGLGTQTGAPGGGNAVEPTKETPPD